METCAASSTSTADHGMSVVVVTSSLRRTVCCLQENIEADVFGKLSHLMMEALSHVADSELHKTIANACLSSGNCFAGIGYELLRIRM